MVRNIDKQHLKTHFGKPRLKDVRRIAIDEISVRKGHTCLTIVMDLECVASCSAKPSRRRAKMS